MSKTELMLGQCQISGESSAPFGGEGIPRIFEIVEPFFAQFCSHVQ